MRADWSGFEGVSGQIMCGGGSVHKDSGGDSNAAMLQVWAWAQVAGAGACVCVDWSGFEGVSGQIMCGGGSVHKESGGDSNAGVDVGTSSGGRYICVCEGAQKRATGTRMRADWRLYDKVLEQEEEEEEEEKDEEELQLQQEELFDRFSISHCYEVCTEDEHE